MLYNVDDMTINEFGALGEMKNGRGSLSTLGENLIQSYIVHHISHMACPWVEPGPPR
jgi:hypothetical protein